MRVLSEDHIKDLAGKGKLSVKERLRSGFATPAKEEEKIVTAEERMAISLDKLTSLVATIALEARKPVEEKDDTATKEINDALGKLTDLIEIITKRLTSPIVKNKKKYELKIIKRDHSGAVETVDIVEK